MFVCLILITAFAGESESESSSPDNEEEDDRTLWEEQQIGKGVRSHKVSSHEYQLGTIFTVSQ